MKNDDLERLEKSQDVQQLIHFAKEQYEQEKSEHTPADFSSLMQAVRKNQKKRMRLKVSPWWLTAACLLGWTIDRLPGGSNTQSDRLPVVTTVIDTVVVIHERVDTVYREVHLKSLVATSNAAKSKSASPKKHARQSEAISERSESDFISSALLQQAMNFTRPGIASAMRQTE